MRARPSWSLVLGLLAVAGAPAAVAEPPATPAPPIEAAVAAGAMAPRGCWAMEDGCAGRTGASADPPLRGSVVPAWSWTVPADLGGAIEEEPRTWLDAVYVTVRTAAGQAALVALGTWDGVPATAPLLLDTPDRLEPCACEEGVVVRSGANELSLVRPVGGRWVTAWRGVGPHATLDAHFVHGGWLYARTDEGLCAWRLWSQPAWVQAGRFGGRPAFGDGALWTLEYDENGNCSLTGKSPVGGAPRPGVFLGHHGTHGRPPGVRDSRITVGVGLGLVDHAVPMKTGVGTARASISDLRVVGQLYDMPGGGALRGEQWVGYGTEKGQTILRLKERTNDGGIRWWDLAGARERPEFCRPDLPSTLTQDVCWVGGGSFHLGDRRVLCRLPERVTRFRVVPAGDRVLSVPEPGRLVAWRAEASPADAPLALGPAFDGQAPRAATGVEGTVLFRDGTLHVGRFDVDPAGARLTPGKGKPRPLADVLVATDAAQRLVHVASLPWLDRHLRRVAFLRSRDAVVAALKDARGVRSADLVERVLFEALLRGAPERVLADARKDVEQMRKGGATPTGGKGAAEAKLAGLVAARPEAVLAVLAASLDDPRPAVQRALLRELLRLRPDHPEAVARVRAALPPHVKPPEPFVARDWIDVGTTLAAIPTKAVDVPPEGARELTPGERELGAARHVWRRDLVGIESAQLLVITPVDAPDRLAACLGLGELVCSALESVFAAGQHTRKSRWPLILQLFGTEEEYRRFQADRLDPDDIRRWSAGHYDPQAGLSRVYVPADDPEMERVREVYAHELAHHWIQERCPLFEAREAKFAKDSPNWIVEGMAVLIESFEWDLAGRTWTTFSPGARLLDEAAHQPERKDWNAFFDLTYVQFRRLDRENRHRVVLRSELGSETKTSDLRAFYASAGAVCTYLFHAGPKERAALLGYVRDAYTGRISRDTKHVEGHFGMTPDALGRAATEWARGVTEGRIQKKDVFLK